MKNFVKKLQELKKLNKRLMPLVAIEAVNFSKERLNPGNSEKACKIRVH